MPKKVEVLDPYMQERAFLNSAHTVYILPIALNPTLRVHPRKDQAGAAQAI